mgnify:FL=1
MKIDDREKRKVHKQLADSRGAGIYSSSIPYWSNHMKYVVKKTAMYGSSTYGPYTSYQEALEALEELEKNTFSECFFSVERVEEKTNRNTRFG